MLSVFAIYFVGSLDSFDISDAEEASSMCVLCITYVGLVILYNTCRPMNTYRAIIFISMFVIITLLIAFLPSYFGIYKMPGLTNTLLCLVIILATIPMVRFFSDILKKVELEKNENQ